MVIEIRPCSARGGGACWWRRCSLLRPWCSGSRWRRSRQETPVSAPPRVPRLLGIWWPSWVAVVGRLLAGSSGPLGARRCVLDRPLMCGPWAAGRAGGLSVLVTVSRVVRAGSWLRHSRRRTLVDAGCWAQVGMGRAGGGWGGWVALAFVGTGWRSAVLARCCWCCWRSACSWWLRAGRRCGAVGGMRVLSGGRAGCWRHLRRRRDGGWFPAGQLRPRCWSAVTGSRPGSAQLGQLLVFVGGLWFGAQQASSRPVR